MNRSPAHSIRRIAGTFLVFLALFVACAGVHAMPCHASDSVTHALHMDANGNDLADPANEDSVPSLEDNNNSLDDTFDVPPEHAVSMLRRYADRPPGLVPPPHAHEPNSDLRPPIA